MKSQTMQKKKETYQRMVIYPNSNFKIFFEFLVAFLLMVTCTLTPISVAFPSFYTWDMQIFDYSMSTVFLIDIIISFFSANYDEDFIIIDNNKVNIWWLTFNFIGYCSQIS